MGLGPLTDLTAGRADVVIGLIDGPVDTTHPDLDGEHIGAAPGYDATCAIGADACVHGTFISGILSARRGSSAPALCPGCTLLVRPIFTNADVAGGELRATSGDLAAAIVDCIDGGARLINISAALVGSSLSGQRALVDALDLAARRGVLVLAAAGNSGLVGGTAITRHGWVCPVIAYTQIGTPLERSDAGRSIGRHGLGALGHAVTSLDAGRRVPDRERNEHRHRICHRRGRSRVVRDSPCHRGSHQVRARQGGQRASARSHPPALGCVGFVSPAGRT